MNNTLYNTMNGHQEPIGLQSMNNSAGAPPIKKEVFLQQNYPHHHTEGMIEGEEDEEELIILSRNTPSLSSSTITGVTPHSLADLSQRKSMETPAIMAIISLATFPKEKIPSEFLQLNFSADAQLTQNLRRQFELCIKLSLILASTEPTGRQQYANFIEIYYNNTPNMMGISSPSFSTASKRYLLWYFTLYQCLDDIRNAATLLNDTYGALQLAHVVNVKLAMVPLLFPQFQFPLNQSDLESPLFRDGPIITLLQLIFEVLSPIRKIAFPPLEQYARDLVFGQIFARCVRLGEGTSESSYGRQIGSIGNLSSDVIHEVMTTTIMNLPDDIRRNPQMLLGGKVTILNAAQTCLQKGYTTLVECAVRQEVLYSIPLISVIKPNFDSIKIKPYLEFQYTYPQPTNVERIFFKSQFEKNKSLLAEDQQKRFQLLQCTLESKVMPVNAVSRDPRVAKRNNPIDSFLSPVTSSVSSSQNTTLNNNNGIVSSSYIKTTLSTSRAQSSSNTAAIKTTTTMRDLHAKLDDAISDCLETPCFDNIFYLLNQQHVDPKYQRKGLGETVMMAAAATGSVEIIRRLHSLGCPILIKDGRNRTPFDIAVMNEREAEVLDVINALAAEELLSVRDQDSMS